MQKTGQIERTIDREFADEEVKYKTCVPPPVSWSPRAHLDRLDVTSYEKECQALQKDSKGFIDAMRGKHLSGRDMMQ